MKNIRAVLIIILFLILPVLIFARDIIIIVEDEDLQLPLEGAAVVLRSGERFVCNADGIARVVLADDRPAIVTVTYPGYENLRLSIPAAVSSAVERYTASLRLGGIMQSQELVVEASRPETSETRAGRSVAITERELTRTAEIGIVEDVMNSVKLLPGVGYTGMFSAMPSIRGGDPGDLVAALDGFYLEFPYHWMGSISIFDPKMVSSARLSHGVFSARYGHTISGLLEVTSKSPSPTETEYEAAIGSSAASLNLSIPFNGKGGLLFMGKITYWDTLVWAAKQLSKVVDDDNLALINSVSTSPYIKSAALSTNYRITADMDWRLSAFFGSDGVGADVKTDYGRFMDEGIDGTIEATAKYDNYQGFLITGLNISPTPKLSLRFTGGVGYNYTYTEDKVTSNISVRYNDSFLDDLKKGTSPFVAPVIEGLRGTSYEAPNLNVDVEVDRKVLTAQMRADGDIDLGNGFIAAFGLQELYSLWKQKEDIIIYLEMPVKSILDNNSNLPPELAALTPFFTMLQGIPNLEILMAMPFKSNVTNHGLTSSAYGLIEYTSPNQRFGIELGLRVDHFYFSGKGFELQIKPALNPRLNIDFYIFKNKGLIDSFSVTAGTGLFRSINSLICFFDPDQFGTGKNIDVSGMQPKFNLSWTSVIGFKIDFAQKYSFNIEGYYKNVSDRAYITASLTSDGITPDFHFDGIGHVVGFDLQLQKLESRYFDGWISYTFTWAKYKDPNAGGEGISMNSINTTEGWYYPSFHRYHNANIVANIKPLTWFNIAVRFGFASGQPQNKVSNKIVSYPVLAVKNDGLPVIIQKYRRDSLPDNEKGLERGAWSFPLDIKFSFFPVNRKGKSNMEIYLAGENLMSVIYKPTSDRVNFNSYTGKEEQEASSASFDLPIPMVSFGFKWRY